MINNRTAHILLLLLIISVTIGLLLCLWKRDKEIEQNKKYIDDLYDRLGIDTPSININSQGNER